MNSFFFTPKKCLTWWSEFLFFFIPEVIQLLKILFLNMYDDINITTICSPHLLIHNLVWNKISVSFSFKIYLEYNKSFFSGSHVCIGLKWILENVEYLINHLFSILVTVLFFPAIENILWAYFYFSLMWLKSDHGVDYVSLKTYLQSISFLFRFSLVP